MFVSIIFVNRSSSGSSRQESPSVPSSKENEKKLHSGKMESSIDEQVQTAADDSLRSDSVPSLPDEKGNFLSRVCVSLLVWGGFQNPLRYLGLSYLM